MLGNTSTATTNMCKDTCLGTNCSRCALAVTVNDCLLALFVQVLTYYLISITTDDNAVIFHVVMIVLVYSPTDTSTSPASQ